MSPMAYDDMPDGRAGERTSQWSFDSEDQVHSPLGRQLSGCKCTEPGPLTGTAESMASELGDSPYWSSMLLTRPELF